MSTIINGTTDAITFPDTTVQNTSAVVSGKVPYSVLPTGSVLQVVNATYNTQVSNSTQTFADTGLTVTITPKFSNSKILVMLNQNGVTVSAVNLGVAILLYRNSTSLGTIINYALYGTPSGDASVGATYLDSPATTSAVTYKTQFAKTVATSGTVYVNSDNGLSTITLMEIAG